MPCLCGEIAGGLVGQVQRQLVRATLTEGEDRSDGEIPGEHHECRVAIQLKRAGNEGWYECVC